MYDAYSLYGATPQAPSYGVAAPTQPLGTDHIGPGWRGLVDLIHNPLTWFGVILLITLGGAGVAGSVRLGRAELRASAGEKD